MTPAELRISVLLQWRATVANELRQLVRDRTGLILLFLMPAVLVLIITLVQDPLLKQEGGGFRIEGLVVDQDGGPAGRIVADTLSRTGAVTIGDTWDHGPLDLEKALKAVNRGERQFYLLIPPGLSAALEDRLSREVNGILDGMDAAARSQVALPELTVCFDPDLRNSYRMAISGAVQQAAAAMETAFGLRLMGQALSRRLGAMNAAGDGAAAASDSAPTMPLEALLARRVSVRQTTAGPDELAALPTAVQQNVPAWALFGMFFIVVPLSSALIRERREGIIDRLKTMPVSLLLVLLGKLTAYTCVCLVQFLCIVMVGKWLLPWLGTDVLVLGDRVPQLALVALCSSLAATGYGILLGSLAATHEQATVVGPVSVVIAAALGGIMVPVFAMPGIMQVLSQASPLAWGHSAFMAILVRGGSWAAIAGWMGLLLLFFFIAVLIGGLAIGRRQ